MAIDTSGRQQVDYFVGIEVENTAMKGEKTLFVVGVKPVDEIVALAEKHSVKHLYFGTSQSFNPLTNEDWKAWNDCIVGCLNKGYWVALDFDVKYAEEIHEEGWCEYERFVPMISVKLPYVRLYNYNATVKIDDRTWGATNPGVWTHQLHDLMAKDKYTYWDQYTQDTKIT